MKNGQWMQHIAYIRTDFSEKFGIPRQSGRVSELLGRVVFLPEFRNPDALREIEGFSHLWLLFDFSKAHRKEWSATVRPPRLGGNRRIGVFASRSPYRPNSIGLSCVRLERVEQTENEGKLLVVSGVDLLDKTPIYDIKPYLPFADAYPEAIGGYAEEQKSHALTVSVSEELLEQIPKEKQKALCDCIREDPRPSYQEDPERVYHMKYAGFDIHFTVKNNLATIRSVERV